MLTENDRLNALLLAGRIHGMALSLPEEVWQAAADSPGLKPEYQANILALIEMRRKLFAREAPDDTR